ncbi:MAG: hypothetical protein JO006_16660 [Paucibacter sp.]|nr:hypothetical protein [Roseateles sp.]
MKFRSSIWGLAAALVVTLVACGGGSGGSSGGNTSAPSNNPGGGTTVSGTSPGAMSSGAITAFGSVFINEHEYDVAKAGLIDDDTGQTMNIAGLEVGQVLDVKVASTSTAMAPAAEMLHMHPLVRGYVDASASNSITVMGQTVQLSSSTLFSDHRACVFAASSPCTAVSGIGGLATTSGSTPGSYVVVDGFLFNSGGSTVNVIASLVAVFDAPGTSPGAAAFKVEGSISAVGTNSITIGGLTVNTANAKCFGSGASMSCAFSTGQVVSAISSAAPSLPATSFDAKAVMLRDRLPVTMAGATLELQGGVSAVNGTSFTLRGISVDASGLPAGTSLPVVGDIVRVLGTVGASGTSISATSVRILRAAASASFAFEGDITNVVTGSAANIFTFTVLGQTVTVNAQTKLADFSLHGWDDGHSQSNPFNIGTFKTYLAASSTQHAIVRTAADASGNLQALSVALVKASSVDGVAGVVDTSPAPVNSTTTGTPSTFSIHGLPVSADPKAIQLSRKLTAISAGDQVLAVGSFASGTLTIGATRGFDNFVVDNGPPRTHDEDDEGF